MEPSTFEEGIAEMVKDGVLTKEDAKELLSSAEDNPEGSSELPLDADLTKPPKTKPNPKPKPKPKSKAKAKSKARAKANNK